MTTPPVLRRPSPLARHAVRLLPSFEKEMLVLRDLVRPGAVCLDVGASYGLYTVALARVVGRSGAVIAFEPRRRSRALLRATAAALCPGNVTVVDVAVGDSSRSDTIVTPKRWWGPVPVPGRSFLKSGLDPGEGGRYYAGWEREFRGASESTVEVRALDDVVAELGLERVDLVKIDVEGAELEVLAGAASTIASWQPVVLCEIEDRHTGKYGHAGAEVLAALAGAGYGAYRYERDRLVAVERLTEGEINYLFVPREDSPGRAAKE